MSDLKEPATYEEQINILQKRGIIISDKKKCRDKLADINFYRLKAYSLPFRNADGSYMSGTMFARVCNLYEFDRKLRRLVFSAIEEVEIFLRARISYFHVHKYGAEGYLNPKHFSTKHEVKKFEDSLRRAKKNNRKALFVKHHVEKYDNHFPLWVIIELFSFGMLSYFYADLKTQDQKELAMKLYDTIPKNIRSWFHCVTNLRNICAHGGRLYYVVFPATPAGLPVEESSKNRLLGALLALKGLYPYVEKWNGVFLKELLKLLEEYKDDISLSHMGFPDEWLELMKK